MKHSVVAGFVICLFLLSICAVTSASGAESVIKLRFTNQFAPSSPNSTIMEAWCKEVDKRTGGKVKVQHYASNVLTSAPTIYDSVAQGVVDVGNHVCGYTAGKFPLTEVFDYPLGYPSGLVATRLMNEYFKKFKPKEFDDVKIMFFHGPGPGMIHSKKPVAKLEDIKGMKMRTFGSNAKLMQLIGGAPVAMPMPDAYDAISRGVADGYFGTYESLKNWKLAEVIKSTTETYGVGYTSTFVVAMNKAKWASIPAEQQKIIEQINDEWIEKCGSQWDQIDKEGKEFSLKRGNKVITLSPEENARWAKAAEPLFEDYVKRMKEKNLPGDEVYKFAREYIKKNAK
jgi:TRAP-type C4-dicarboxylate transport system substrate-binding protein